MLGEFRDNANGVTPIAQGWQQPWESVAKIQNANADGVASDSKSIRRNAFSVGDCSFCKYPGLWPTLG